MNLWLKTWRAKVLTHVRYGEASGKNTSWETGERFVHKHLRWIAGHQKKSTIASIYDETKILPLSSLRDISMLRMWGKVVSLPQNNLLKSLYENEKKQITKSYWAQALKKNLQKTESDEILERSNTCL